jgi:hypothetical protein
VVRPSHHDLSLRVVHGPHNRRDDTLRSCHGRQRADLASDVVGRVTVDGRIDRTGQDGADRDVRGVAQLLSQYFGVRPAPRTRGPLRPAFARCVPLERQSPRARRRRGPPPDRCRWRRQ